MNIKQGTFEQIVADAALLLDEKHAHVQTVTGSSDPVPFRMDSAVLADALLQALALNGITVGAESDVESAVTFLKLNQDRFGISVNRDGDTLRIERVGASDGGARQ